MKDLISRADAIEAVDNTDWYHINKNGEMVQGATSEMEAWYKAEDIYKALESLPSADAVQGWNNHEVACMLAELFGDACACNYNGIDEWLPLVCDLKDSCPNTVGVACWEQFLKHYERREP